MPEFRLYDKPVCDFCSSDKPQWHYPAKSFWDSPSQAESMDGWLACDECAHCILRNEWNKLAWRGTTAAMKQEAVRQAGEEFALRHVTRFHQEFRKNRSGRTERWSPPEK